MSDRVTSHAIARWAERVHGIDLAGLRQGGIDDAALARAASGALGMSVAEAAAEICPPFLEAALALGATSVRRPGYRLLVRNGSVTTVILGDVTEKPGTAGLRRNQRKHAPRRDDRRVRRDLRAIVDEWEARS